MLPSLLFDFFRFAFRASVCRTAVLLLVAACWPSPPQRRRERLALSLSSAPTGWWRLLLAGALQLLVCGPFLLWQVLHDVEALATGLGLAVFFVCVAPVCHLFARTPLPALLGSPSLIWLLVWTLLGVFVGLLLVSPEPVLLAAVASVAASLLASLASQNNTDTGDNDDADSAALFRSVGVELACLLIAAPFVSLPHVFPGWLTDLGWLQPAVAGLLSSSAWLVHGRLSARAPRRLLAAGCFAAAVALSLHAMSHWHTGSAVVVAVGVAASLASVCSATAVASDTGRQQAKDATSGHRALLAGGVALLVLIVCAAGLLAVLSGDGPSGDVELVRFDAARRRSWTSRQHSNCAFCEEMARDELPLQDFGWYTGWLGHGNTGDDVLYAVFLRVLAAALAQRYPDAHVALHYVDAFDWSHTAPQCSCTKEQLPHSNFVVIGGGSVLGTTAEYFARLPHQFFGAKQSPLTAMPGLVFGSGVDDFTGQLSYADVAALLAGRSTATCPQLADDLPFVQSALRRIGTRAHGFLRDDFTARQIECLLDGEAYPLPAGYDPGLLAAAYLDEAPLPHRVATDVPFVAVNVGSGALLRAPSGPVDDDDDDDDDELAFLKSLVVSLLDQYPVVLYSLFPGDTPLCLKLQRAVERESTRYQAVALHGVLADDEVLSLHRRAQFVVAYKLHSAVLAAATRTPFIAVAYRAKVVGFAHSVGMQDYLLPLGASVERFAAVVRSVERHAEDIADRLGQHVERAQLLVESAVYKFTAALPSVRLVGANKVRNVLIESGLFTSSVWQPQDGTQFGAIRIVFS